MNERIEKLAEQAMTATTNKFSADREWSADEWRDFYDTKFAELIVKECVDVANSKAEGIDLGSKLYLYKEDIEDTIKKHFGVEE